MSRQKDLVSLRDLSKETILYFLQQARFFQQNVNTEIAKGNVMASLFFEPSTRTRLSFEAAMQRLGGSVIGFDQALNSSQAKGESLQDCIRVVSSYVDLIVLRHPLQGAARLAAEVSQKPLINAGDGANQHPSQTLIDLFSIQETQGSLENLHIALAGDLLHARTVHSFVQALLHFQPRVYFVAPRGLELPRALCRELRDKSIKFSFHERIEQILSKIDILYMTRLQKERLEKGLDRQTYLKSVALDPDLLESFAKKNLKILHPLPRLYEISPQIDESPHAYYFEQASHGLAVRQAVLAHFLKEEGSFDTEK